VPRGALVDRLSMGDPAPNGDFSGVVKNSFLIRRRTHRPARLPRR
jgi:PmbA protein